MKRVNERGKRKGKCVLRSAACATTNRKWKEKVWKVRANTKQEQNIVEMQKSIQMWRMVVMERKPIKSHYKWPFVDRNGSFYCGRFLFLALRWTDILLDISTPSVHGAPILSDFLVVSTKKTCFVLDYAFVFNIRLDKQQQFHLCFEWTTTTIALVLRSEQQQFYWSLIFCSLMKADCILFSRSSNFRIHTEGFINVIVSFAKS